MDCARRLGSSALGYLAAWINRHQPANRSLGDWSNLKRKGVMRKDLFVVIFLLAATCAQAQTAKIVGIGASSCAHFNEETARSPSTQRDYFAWAQGFMSGVELRAPLGQDEKLDLAPPSFPLNKQAAFLREFCSKNSSQNFADAVLELYLRLRGPETRA
jgi:hypothetical protein